MNSYNSAAHGFLRNRIDRRLRAIRRCGVGVLTSIFLVAGFVAGCGAGALVEVTVGVPGMLSPAALAFSVAIFYAPQNETKPQ